MICQVVDDVCSGRVRRSTRSTRVRGRRRRKIREVLGSGVGDRGYNTVSGTDVIFYKPLSTT